MRRAVPVALVVTLELVVLGLGAAVLVLFVIPKGFSIEWACMGSQGVQRTGGDTYVGAFTVLGTAGRLGVLLASVYAGITGRPHLVVLLPVAWAVVLVLAAVLAGALVGPELCPR